MSADFRMIRPVAVTDVRLISSTVPEALVTDYAGGSTYALGDIRGVTTGTAQVVYQSLQASNTGHTPASSPTWWKLLGTVYAPYSAGTTYALGAIVSSIATNVHELYESQIAGNVGQAVANNPTKWLRRSATNRWNMFDKAINSQTVAPTSVSVVIQPGLVNTITLLNVEGASATVSQSISGYSVTKSLVRHDVLNWYDFFYEEPIRAGDVVFDGIPPYAAANITITVDNAGLNAAIGGCFVGKSRTIGLTQWELTAGVLSYSTVSTDTFGNVTMVKRANAKKMNFDVRIPEGFESEAFRLLTEYTDVEMVFIASSDYSMTIAYGYLGQWEVPISNSGRAAPIEVRGLI
ncbi:hypothetical protein [Massilia pseudoviolaceinigra]|uniref:hypothetical protein n=1 Tax=Massilia pseudoviolaceinigra TaxID=3057165 RepID=UPI0027969341|nr:hypothetical protein [Massilia sp. CCM 9206]MDQ1920552.1 hypothetical protein [Massilia sp. CCM 9206]